MTALLAQALAFATGLALLGVVLRLRGGEAKVRPGLAHDLGHVALRIAVYMPLIALALHGVEGAVTRWAPGMRLGLLSAAPGWVQILVWIVLIDFLGYWIHRIFHTVPQLWPFHAVHHAAVWLNPITTTRVHLVELGAKKLLMWVPLAVLGQPDEGWLVWMVLDGFLGFFTHSGLPISLGPLGRLVVAPTFHHLHHSTAREHYDANFGERLAIWDVIFGTARFDRPAQLVVGVDEEGFPEDLGTAPFAVLREVWAQFVYPFRKIARGP